MSEFDDIINLSRPVSKKHPPMPRISRAAQFGAFRALTGHEEAISEEARLTDSMIEIDREKTEELNLNMSKAKELLFETPLVSVTYFIPDERKSGGRYVTFKSNLRIIDEVHKELIFTDGTRISFLSILNFNLVQKPEKDVKN